MFHIFFLIGMLIKFNFFLYGFVTELINNIYIILFVAK